MKLKYKMPIILSLAFCLIMGALIMFILTGSEQVHRANQFESSKSLARWRADELKGFFNVKIAELNGLGSYLGVAKYLNEAEKLDMLKDMLHVYMSKVDRDLVLNTFMYFERGAFFDGAATGSGRFYGISAYAVGKDSISRVSDPSASVEVAADWYRIPRQSGLLHMTEPVSRRMPGGGSAEYMVMRLAAPIVIDGNFLGVVGIDMDANAFTPLFSAMRDPALNSFVTFLSGSGLRIWHPREESRFVMAGTDMPADEQNALLSAMREGREHLVFRRNLATGAWSLVPYAPVHPEGLDRPWSVAYVVPLAALQVDEIRLRGITTTAGIISAVVWLVFVIGLLSGTFNKLSRTIASLGRMTEGGGDLTIRFDKRGGGEVGQMAKGLNTFTDKLQETISTTQRDARVLLETSERLYELSHSLSNISDATLKQATSAAGESTDMNQNVRGIADEAEQISSSAEELTATANEMNDNMDSVAHNVSCMNKGFAKMNTASQHSKKIADQAIAEVTDAINVMGALGEAAREIGQFTEVIMGIAKKTNLLAINATVEAARAGEAGKGFAVVAGEVKQLANQSAENANDITNRIESIQKGTANAIEVINKISASMTKVSESANALSQSIERETRESDEMAANAKQTSDSAKQVVHAIQLISVSAQKSAQSASDAAQGTEIVSGNINSIHESAERTNVFSKDLKEAAGNLKDMATRLNSIVCKFKT
jgi:methyl-accepting chemotaxis protein